MWGVPEMLRSRLFPRAAVLALVAACSLDTSRFNDYPFASLGQPDATASIPRAQTAQGPSPRSAPATVATSAGTGATPGSPGTTGIGQTTP